MVASGFAALGYQIVWTQQCALWLGHESAAVLAVVTAFFGGLALGSLALGRRIEGSGHPGRWYAACEAVIALWGAALALAMPAATETLLRWTGAQPAPVWQWSVAFAGCFLLLLPATAAMGATLPAMARALSAWPAQRGVGVAALYAANTLGAVLGVLATAFWLLPAFGLWRTTVLCIVLNLAAALAALRVLDQPAAPVAPLAPVAPELPIWRWRLLLAATGLLGIGYELLVVRVLGQVTESTVYTFALLLAAYLVGSTVGAAAYQRWGATRAGAAQADPLLGLLAAACLLAGGGLWAAASLHKGLLPLLGDGMAAALAAEAALALAALLPPALVMGALFSHLCTRAARDGLAFSTCLGVNTVGAALAAPLFGVLAVPAVGPKVTLLLLVAGYLLLRSRRSWARAPMWTLVGALGALSWWAPPLALVDVPEGGRLLSYREGALGAVSVVEDADGVASLHIDNHQQEGSSATRLADARQALLPLLLHPAPRRALFLGLGTGVTAASAAQDAQLQLDVVELVPEVIAASAFFTGDLLAQGAAARMRVLAADARRFVRAPGPAYDLVVADNFHPARSGSAWLYTREHFQAVRERLAPAGLFCQWLPLHQLDLATLRSVVRSFLVVFPDARAVLATNSLDTPVLGLLGRSDGGAFDVVAVRQRLAGAALPQPPAQFGLADEFALLGSFIAGPRALARFAADAEPNTDDHPVVAYRAPRITYAPDSLPRDRLTALLQAVSVAPSDVLGAGADETTARRLGAYWHARDGYLAAGRDVRASHDVQRMLAQVREPLLTALRISPDFRPAYDPLLRMAAALAQTDRPAARQLLQELTQLQPARPEAATALQQLAAVRP